MYKKSNPSIFRPLVHFCSNFMTIRLLKLSLFNQKFIFKKIFILFGTFKTPKFATSISNTDCTG